MTQEAKERVLLADDNPQVREMLSRLLSRSMPEYDIECVRSGAELRERSAERDYAAYLIDYQLGDETAPQLIRELRGKGVRAPIIQLTGRGEAELAVEAMKSGATDCLFKGLFSGELLTLALRGALARHREQEEHRRADQERAAVERRYRALIENSLDGIALLDASGNTLEVTPSLQRILGYAPVERLGRNTFELVHPDDVGRIMAQLQRLVSVPGLTMKDQLRYRHKNGSWRWMECVGMNLLEEPAVRALVVNFRDATARKAAEDEIRKLNDDLECRVRERTAELEQSLRELESFAYSIAHDLRGPVRGINGYSAALLEDYGTALDEQGRGFLERIRNDSVLLGKLIDALLGLARVNRVEMNLETVDLGELARQAFDGLSQREPERAARLEVGGDLQVKGDPLLLRVAIDNLISNAWKFTRPRSQAVIEVGRTDRGGKSCFFVRDNGVGMDMQFAHKLFQPFQRLHSLDEFEGTGVGLATVERIVRRHGGQVWVESAPDHGAMFLFTLC